MPFNDTIMQCIDEYIEHYMIDVFERVVQEDAQGRYKEFYLKELEKAAKNDIVSYYKNPLLTPNRQKLFSNINSFLNLIQSKTTYPFSMLIDGKLMTKVADNDFDSKVTVMQNVVKNNILEYVSNNKEKNKQFANYKL